MFAIKFIFLMILIAKCFALDVTCDFNDLQWPTVGTKYSCSVKSFSSDERSAQITNVRGGHQPRKSNSDVKFLDIKSLRLNAGIWGLQELSKGFENFFPNIEGLRVANTRLSGISKSDIRVFPKLRHLDLSNNDFVRIESDLFEENLEIKFLNFRNNKLFIIGHDIFKPLKNLTKAFFLRNACIDQDASENSQITALQATINLNCVEKKQLKSFHDSEREFEEMKENYDKNN